MLKKQLRLRYIIFVNAWKTQEECATIDQLSHKLTETCTISADRSESSLRHVTSHARPTAWLRDPRRSGYFGKSATSLANNYFIMSVGIFFCRESYLNQKALHNTVIWYLKRLQSFKARKQYYWFKTIHISLLRFHFFCQCLLRSESHVNMLL